MSYCWLILVIGLKLFCYDSKRFGVFFKVIQGKHPFRLDISRQLSIRILIIFHIRSRRLDVWCFIPNCFDSCAKIPESRVRKSARPAETDTPAPSITMTSFACFKPLTNRSNLEVTSPGWGYHFDPDWVETARGKRKSLEGLVGAERSISREMIARWNVKNWCWVNRKHLNTPFLAYLGSY